jgi:hypothetical protein
MVTEGAMTMTKFSAELPLESGADAKFTEEQALNWLTANPETGKTVREIAAITGHTTLKEVERYTKAFDRERLARSAMARMAVAQDMDRGSQRNG